MQDFNEYSNACDTLDDDELDNLGRYQRFEKSFPFYKMDVNGFMVLIKRAMRLTYADEPDKPLWQIKHITLEALRESFKNNKTWSEALQDKTPPTELIMFLNDTCRIESNEYTDIPPTAYSVRKLKCVGLLWCDGTSKEKVVELYDMI